MAHLYICPNCGTRSNESERTRGFSREVPACRKCGFPFLFELLDDYYPAPDAAFFVCDGEGRVIRCGRGSFELTGLDDERVIGRPVREVLGLRWSNGDDPVHTVLEWGVRASEAGLASGLINTSQQVGGALGIAALSSLATSTTAEQAARGTALPFALTDGFQAAFVGGAAVAAVGVLVALFVVRGRDLTETAPAPAPADLEAALVRSSATRRTSARRHCRAPRPSRRASAIPHALTPRRRVTPYPVPSAWLISSSARTAARARTNRSGRGASAATSLPAASAASRSCSSSSTTITPRPTPPSSSATARAA